MRQVLIELHHLPCLAYFSAVLACNRLVLERHENYQKQSYRNRCRIPTAQRVEVLTVPVKQSRHVLVGDVPIDYSQRWEDRYCRTLRAAYGRAPFFEYYIDPIEKHIRQRHDYLWDLNMALLKTCLKMLKVDLELGTSSLYEVMADPQVEDLRNVINVRKPEDSAAVYSPVPYTQVFSASFEPNMSVIDALFCCGPEALTIIRKSCAER